MIQWLSRWIGGIALHWFYRDIAVTGVHRLPARGPVLLAVNHQNAMVDAILAQAVVPWPLRLTAKATLASNPLGALFVKAMGIIPLRRTSDERAPNSDPMRNRSSFVEIVAELARGGTVLIFPEGKSHNDPVVAPLKTGLARAALRARADGVRGLHIVPLGFTFEHKGKPGTMVAAQVGEPILVDTWPGDEPHALTEEVAHRLSAVSLTAPLRTLATPPQRSWPIRLAAWWGRFIHKIPIELARWLAARQSTNEDEPAMYTMVYGLGFILLSCVVQISVIGMLGGAAAALIYTIMLLIGAYWAAHEEHVVAD